MRRSGFRRKGRGRRWAVRTTIDNITFASKLEASLYVLLKIQLNTGLISEFEMQKEFELRVNDCQICIIIPDFFYYDKFKRKHVVHEAKGVEEKDWKVKWKLLKALHPEYDYELYTDKTRYI